MSLIMNGTIQFTMMHSTPGIITNNTNVNSRLIAIINDT